MHFRSRDPETEAVARNKVRSRSSASEGVCLSLYAPKLLSGWRKMAASMEGLEWRQARQWLINSEVIPPTHRVTKPSVDLVDFARSLRDGVFLCSLANKLKPNCVEDWSPKPLMQVRGKPFVPSIAVNVGRSPLRWRSPGRRGTDGRRGSGHGGKKDSVPLWCLFRPW